MCGHQLIDDLDTLCEDARRWPFPLVVVRLTAWGVFRPHQRGTRPSWRAEFAAPSLFMTFQIGGEASDALGTDYGCVALPFDRVVE